MDLDGNGLEQAAFFQHPAGAPDDPAKYRIGAFDQAAEVATDGAPQAGRQHLEPRPSDVRRR
jgi:hypothetical protein